MAAPFNFAMDYIIGAGAILETGEAGSIAPATLHANVDAPLGASVAAAAIDFEGTSAQGLQRLVIMAQGWNAARFRTGVTDALRGQRTCTLADVLATLARAAGTSEVHFFAHWLPGEQTCAQLAQSGVLLVSHPLESISAASLVTGQRYRRYSLVA